VAKTNSVAGCRSLATAGRSSKVMGTQRTINSWPPMAAPERAEAAANTPTKPNPRLSSLPQIRAHTAAPLAPEAAERHELLDRSPQPQGGRAWPTRRRGQPNSPSPTSSVGRLAARRGTSAASQWTARRSGRLPRTGEWRRPCSGTGGAETGGSTQGRSSTGIYSTRPRPRRPGSPPPGTGEMCSAGPCRRAPRPVRDRGTTKLVFQRIDMTNLRHCGTASMKCLLKFTRLHDSALNQINNMTRWLD
jgi:hypothetical protein